MYLIIMIAGFWIIALAGAAGCWVCYKLGAHDEREKIIARQAEVRAREHQLAVESGRQPWMAYLPPPGPIRSKTHQLPAFTPHPPVVPLEPSETGTFKLTDTGEMRAIKERGDAIMAGIKAGRSKAEAVQDDADGAA